MTMLNNMVYMPEQEIGNDSCLICGKYAPNAIVVTSAHSYVTASSTPLMTFLTKVIGEEPCFYISEIICQQCYILLDRLDAYQERASEIIEHISCRYKNTKSELLGNRTRLTEVIAASLADVDKMQNGTTLNISKELTITVLHEASRNKRHCDVSESCLQRPQKSMRYCDKENYYKHKKVNKSMVDEYSKCEKKAVKCVNMNNNSIKYSSAVQNLVGVSEMSRRTERPEQESSSENDDDDDDEDENNEEESNSDSDNSSSDVSDESSSSDADDEDNEGDEEEGNSSSSSDSEIKCESTTIPVKEKGENCEQVKLSSQICKETEQEDKKFVNLTSREVMEINDTSEMVLEKTSCSNIAAKEVQEKQQQDAVPDSISAAVKDLVVENQTVETNACLKKTDAAIEANISPVHNQIITTSAVAGTEISVPEMMPAVAEAVIMQNPVTNSLLQSFLATSLWLNSPDASQKQSSISQINDDITSETISMTAGGLNDKKRRQELKNTGKSYINTKGKLIKAKHVWPQDCSKCIYKCSMHINDEGRQKVFEEYWALGDYKRQREFLASHMQREEKMGPNGVTRNIILYFLTHDHQKLQVCRQFFLKTLDVSEKASRIVLEKKLRGEFDCDLSSTGREQIDSST